MSRRLALDTNILVTLHMPVLPQHAAVRRAILHWSREGGTTLVLTPIVMQEFVHVITDARRFDPPVSMSEALAISQSYLGRSTVEWVAPDESCLDLAFRVMDQHGLGRKRISDCVIGATYLRAEVDGLVTLDRTGYRVFPKLVVIDPLER